MCLPGSRTAPHPTRNGVSRSGGSVAYFAVRRETHGMAAYGTTRKRLAARINSANRGKADSDAAARDGLRSTPDCRPRRAYLHLSYSYASPFGPALLVTQ